MKKLGLFTFLIAFCCHADNQSKCNIDTFGDPNNKPECYKSFPQALNSKMKFGGWPDGTVLKKDPDDKSKTLLSLGQSDHWSDLEIELTGKNKGEWSEVILRQFNKKLESCDEIRKVKKTRKGWIKSSDSDGKPLLWTWLYSGLC